MMDMEERRKRLVARINATGFDPAKPGPLFGLEEFFEGNYDEGSIAVNLPRHPGNQEFYKHLKGIRDRLDVQDVLIEIRDIEDSPGIWPYSDTVWILTSVSLVQVQSWMAPLEPDEISESMGIKTHAGAPELRNGIRAYFAWWD